MSVLTCVRRLGVALTLASALGAQSIDSLRPQAVAPGALLQLDGRELAGAALVRFTALGPGGTLLVREQPLLHHGSALLAVVPAFSDAGSAPLSPWGWVSVPGARPVPLFLLEGTAGRVSVAGAGSQLGERRLGVSFDPAAGPPDAGNAGFTLTLHGAPAGRPAMVLAGLPRAGPRLRLRDAALGLDFASSFIVAGFCLTDGEGRAELQLPVPLLSGVSIAALWVVAAPEGLAFSDTLLACL
jgi:hypothetical protein